MKKIITIAILCLMARAGFAQSTNTFEYDNLNRLTKVTYANGAVVQYTYDAVGNRLTKTVAGVNIQYAITAAANPSNGGTITGAGTYDAGATCTLTATANEDYTFVNWTKNGSVVSTSANYSFTVTGGGTYVANFSQNSYTISASANPSAGGSVSGGGTYNHGSTCTLTATANTGYTFTNWTKNGTVVSTNANYSFTVSSSGTYVANFEAENIIVFADPNVKAICVANWDTNGSGELSYAEAAAVTSLGQVFRGDTTITSFEELQYFTGLSTISSNAFRDCSNLTGLLNIPNSVTSIGMAAFWNCSGLCALTIPNSVTLIQFFAFYGCSGLTSVYYTGDIAQWCGISFYDSFSNPLSDAHNLYIDNELVTDLVIPNSVTSIGNYAFYGCSGFTGPLTIPNSVTSIGNSAFSGCTGFTGSLTIPNSVTFIGDAAFQSCRGFTGSLTIPDSVTSIGNYTFSYCSGLTGSLAIPNSVTSIGNYAFSNCSGLTGSLTIPDSVTSIGNNAFYYCSRFASMNIMPETPPTLGSGVFVGVPKSIPVNVPCASIASYQAADGWNEFTNYHGIDCPSYVISAAANPTEGGTVSGAGTYDEGATCTLTATANAGYQFVNWTENGEVISTETTYSFTVTDDRTLVANFEEAITTAEQTISLSQGWNWFSTFIEVEDPLAMLETVEAALGANGQVIKNSEMGTEYDSEWGWFGDLDDVGMTNEQMYKIQVSAPCTLSLEGVPANAAEHPIIVNPGWNWIGFPSRTQICLDDAFAGFAQEGDKIRNSAAEIVYDPDWGWFGDFGTLVPGQGYMYYSASSVPRTLVFPTSTK